MICCECAHISFSSANVQRISLTSFIFNALHLQSMFSQIQVLFSAVIDISNLFFFLSATEINENSSEIPRSAQKNNIQKWENLLLKRKPFWKRKGEKRAIVIKILVQTALRYLMIYWLQTYLQHFRDGRKIWMVLNVVEVELCGESEQNLQLFNKAA